MGLPIAAAALGFAAWFTFPAASGFSSAWGAFNVINHTNFTSPNGALTAEPPPTRQ